MADCNFQRHLWSYLLYYAFYNLTLPLPHQKVESNSSSNQGRLAIASTNRTRWKRWCVPRSDQKRWRIFPLAHWSACPRRSDYPGATVLRGRWATKSHMCWCSGWQCSSLNQPSPGTSCKPRSLQMILAPSHWVGIPSEVSWSKARSSPRCHLRTPYRICEHHTVVLSSYGWGIMLHSCSNWIIISPPNPATSSLICFSKSKFPFLSLSRETEQIPFNSCWSTWCPFPRAQLEVLTKGHTWTLWVSGHGWTHLTRNFYLCPNNWYCHRQGPWCSSMTSKISQAKLSSAVQSLTQKEIMVIETNLV